LWEEGKFALDDPIGRFIPQLANLQVLRPGATTRGDTEPARSPITIRQLLTHTSGLTYGFMHSHPVDALYREAGFDAGKPNTDDLATACAKLAALPLLFQPGTEWNYSMAIDVLGRVIEVKVTETHKWHISGHITNANPKVPHPASNAAYFAERENQRVKERAEASKGTQQPPVKVREEKVKVPITNS
jgi:hypothetical protein